MTTPQTPESQPIITRDQFLLALDGEEELTRLLKTALDNLVHLVPEEDIHAGFPSVFSVKVPGTTGLPSVWVVYVNTKQQHIFQIQHNGPKRNYVTWTPSEFLTAKAPLKWMALRRSYERFQYLIDGMSEHFPGLRVRLADMNSFAMWMEEQ